jgi:hypothetical protein
MSACHSVLASVDEGPAATVGVAPTALKVARKLAFAFIAKQHGGTLATDSRTGDFTEFVIVLPRSMAPFVVAGAGGRR